MKGNGLLLLLREKDYVTCKSKGESRQKRIETTNRSLCCIFEFFYKLWHFWIFNEFIAFLLFFI
jgi:hypothetical protein